MTPLGAARALRRVTTHLATVLAAVAGWNFVACALFVCFDVLARNLARFSSAATVEITGYMLAGGVALALSHTLLERAHIRVDVLVNRLPLRARQWLHAIALLMLAGFACFVAWAAWELVDESALFDAHDNSALRIPMVIPQGIWATGISVFALTCLLLLAETALLLAAGRAAEIDTLLGSRTLQDETREALDAVRGIR